MRPWRFLLCVLGAYVVGVSAVTFFVYAAVLLVQQALVYVGLFIAVGATTVGGWLYYRGVPYLTWRQRAEAIVVWIGLVYLNDLLLGLMLFHQSPRLPSMTALTTYAAQVGMLFLVAHLARGSTPSESPDLLVAQSALPPKTPSG